MSKTYTITLGGETYTCHPFNLGELEDIADLTDTLSGAKAGFAILRLALARATPAVPDPRLLEGSAAEVEAAITAVMRSSGMEIGAADSGEARPATAA